MTKEELKKEAEESARIYFDSLDYDHGNVSDTPFSAYDVFVAYEQGALDFAEPREKRIAELEEENTDLKEEINKTAFARGNLEEENAELKEELKKWKDEWQEQVQKATDEGYARTLQTIQLTKAKEIIKIFLKYEICTLNIKEELADNIAKAEQFLNSEVEK